MRHIKLYEKFVVENYYGYDDINEKNKNKLLQEDYRETTFNSSITELVPVLLFNSKKEVNNNPNEILQVIKEFYLEGKNTGILSQDFAAAAKTLDYIESNLSLKPKILEKIVNAYAIYKWLLEHEKNTEPIKIIYWAYRTKPEGVPSKSAADIVIEYENGKMLGISLKSGTQSSKEPLVNSYLMNLINSISPELENDLRQTVWDNIYSKILDIYSSEINTETDITQENFYIYGKNSKSKSKQLLEILDWYEKNYYNDYLSKYYLLQRICRDFCVRCINIGGEKFNKWLSDKMNLEDTFPVIVLKAIKNKVEEVQSAGKEKMAAILNIEKIYAQIDPQRKSMLFAELSDETKMWFEIRSNANGLKHMLGSFYNLSLQYKGIH